MLEALLCLIYFLHMPLFLFISGMLSKNAPKRRNRAFTDLIVPFLVAQVLWLVWLACTVGPGYALSQTLVPQFALWYLVALFAWRLALLDLVRVRLIPPVSIGLFLFGQLFGGIDNTLAIQRARIPIILYARLPVRFGLRVQRGKAHSRRTDGSCVHLGVRCPICCVRKRSHPLPDGLRSPRLRDEYR